MVTLTRLFLSSKIEEEKDINEPLVGNNEIISISVSFTGQHENEAQSGNYGLRLFMRKKF